MDATFMRDFLALIPFSVCQLINSKPNIMAACLLWGIIKIMHLSENKSL